MIKNTQNSVGNYLGPYIIADGENLTVSEITAVQQDLVLRKYHISGTTGPLF